MYKLRELKRKDLYTINNWRNYKELTSFLGAPYRFINYEVDVKWYESYMNNRGNAIRCAITNEDDGNDEILGLISLVSINYVNQSAELHIMIGSKDNQGKGIGTFAVNAMLYHAFNNMNLHRIKMSVLDSNGVLRICIKNVNLYMKEGNANLNIRMASLRIFCSSQ